MDWRIIMSTKTGVLMQPLKSAMGLETLSVVQSVLANRSRNGFPAIGLTETVVFLVGLVAFLLFAPAKTNAQVAGGSITGTVRGESGAAMPGVRVSITDASASSTRTVTTDTDGFYNAPDLPPGIYEMTISAPGFATQ